MATLSASQEQVVYGADNASASGQDYMSPVPSGFSLFQPRVALGFGLILLIVLARVFGGKRKLPAGVKPLPRLPGTYLTRIKCIGRED